MTSDRMFLFWALLLVIVPLVSGALGRPGARIDRYFFGTCVLLAFVLLAFTPRFELPVLGWLLATLVFSAAVVALYVLLVPSARGVATPVLGVVGVLDMVSLLVAHLAGQQDFARPVFAAVLLAATGAAGVAATWPMRRMYRERPSR